MSKPKFEPLDPGEFDKLPGPLFTLLSLCDAEDNSFRKVHRLIDAFEWASKWHTVLAVADLLREAEVPANMKVLFATGLRTPSLGTWNLFFREAMAAIKQPSMPFGEWERLTSLEKRHQIVAFRNGYAHGATPSDEECERDIKRMYPVLLQLLGSELFKSIQLVASGPDGVLILRGSDQEKTGLTLESGKTGALLPDGLLLELWPLGVYTQGSKVADEWGFYFFNALKG